MHHFKLYNDLYGHPKGDICLQAVTQALLSACKRPADLVARARTVVVDQLADAQLESGDLIQAHAAGKFEWDRAAELGSVVAGTWRAPDQPGITLFESHGLAIWDLAAASVVLPAARERGLGEEVAFFSA